MKAPRKTTTTTGKVRQRSEGYPVNGEFTFRRKKDKFYKKIEFMESVRTRINKALKIEIADDMNKALADGVILCLLANHVRPHSVSTIYFPSPAAPTLTLAKAVYNVEKFLVACGRLGVHADDLCSQSDVTIRIKSIEKVLHTVDCLLNVCDNGQQVS